MTKLSEVRFDVNTSETLAVEYNLPDVGPKTGVGIEFTNIDSDESNVLADIFRKSVDEAKSEAESEQAKGEEEECSKTGEWTPPEDEELLKKK